VKRQLTDTRLVLVLAHDGQVIGHPSQVAPRPLTTESAVADLGGA